MIDLEEFEKWFGSPEGKAYLDDFIDKMEKKMTSTEEVDKRIRAMSSADFNDYLHALIKEDDAESLYTLFEVALHFGEQISEPIDDFDATFGMWSYKYKDHLFNWINGQGTVLRIFNMNIEEIYRS